MATISIDLRMLYASGIGTYIRNMVPRVINTFSGVRFHLLGDAEAIGRFPWSQGDRLSIIECHAPIYSIAEQVELVRKIPRDTSLFWSPHYNVPLLYSGKLLVSVYDVFHLAMPQYVYGMHKRLYAKGMFYALGSKASAVLSCSDFTVNELKRLAGRQPRQVHTIYLGVDDSWFQLEKRENPVGRPYLLFVGNVKPHKNLGALLEAFRLCLRRVPHDLVIVGKKEGFITGDAALVDRAAELGDRVRFTGYVTDEALQQYFVHADALVLPSLYEGFGLPPLEAMACGCPAVVSNVASLPEVCGDAALYCDPYNPGDIASKIELIVADGPLREALRSRGVKQAKRFTWEKTAKETVAVIERLLAE